MTDPGHNHLTERGVTVTELKAEIRRILSGGDEYTAREISNILEKSGRDASVRRVANTIKDMLGVDRKLFTSPVKGNRLYYLYKKDATLL